MKSTKLNRICTAMSKHLKRGGKTNNARTYAIKNGVTPVNTEILLKIASYEAQNQI